MRFLRSPQQCADDSNLRRCDTLLLGKRFQIFWRIWYNVNRLPSDIITSEKPSTIKTVTVTNAPKLRQSGGKKKKKKLDIHGSVHCRWFSRNTNKIQLCKIIYYSKIYWSLNVFRAAHRSSSGVLNCVCSLWFIYPCGDRLLPRQALATAGHHMGI